MSISVDDATVVRWTGTPSGTTAIVSASFTPPNNSFLVCCPNADELNGTSHVEITVSGGGLTWTQQIKRGSTESGTGGISAIWTASVGTGASMTCSVARSTNATSGGSNRLSAKLYIVSSQAASPIGASNSADYTTDPQNLSLTTTGAGRLFGNGWDGNNATAGTSTDTFDAAGYAGAGAALSAYKNADHASGTSQSINFNPAAAPAGNLVVLETLAAAAGGTTIYTRTPLRSPIFNSRILS